MVSTKSGNDRPPYAAARAENWVAPIYGMSGNGKLFEGASHEDLFKPGR